MKNKKLQRAADKAIGDVTDQINLMVDEIHELENKVEEQDLVIQMLRDKIESLEI